MPLILFIFGLFLILLFNIKIKTILLLSFVPMFILCKFIISTDESYKQQYITYYYNFKNLVNFFPESSLILKYEIIKSETDNLQQSNLSYDVRWETNHKRLFLAALDTWKSHKIFGNGIKSFRIDCPKLAGPDINLEEDIIII